MLFCGQWNNFPSKWSSFPYAVLINNVDHVGNGKNVQLILTQFESMSNNNNRTMRYNVYNVMEPFNVIFAIKLCNMNNKNMKNKNINKKFWYEYS